MVPGQRPEKMAPVVDRSTQAVKKDERRTLAGVRDAVTTAVDLHVAQHAFSKELVAEGRQTAAWEFRHGRAAAHQPGKRQPERFHPDISRKSRTTRIPGDLMLRM